MQQLKFEAKWEKTIAQQDRLWIEQVFDESKKEIGDHMVFTPIRQAINHRKDLLVSVLIHNPTKSNITFQNQEVGYWEKDQLIAKYCFDIPALLIPPKTSMPWTFIFPEHCLNPNFENMNGYLVKL